MKLAPWTIAITAGCAVLTASSLFLSRGMNTPPPAKQPGPSGARPVVSEPTAQIAPEPVEATSLQENQPAVESISDRFRGAEDYLEFARSIHAAAKNRQPDAQYFLSKAIEFCSHGYKLYFERGQKTKTRDEAAIWASTRPGYSVNEVDDVYTKCNRLKDAGPEQFGSAEELLRQSAAAGYPPAQSDIADSLFLQAELGSLRQKTDRPVSELQTEARELLAKAVRSRDPAIIFQIGGMQKAITGSLETATTQQWVWRLAACERGYDCSETAPWVELACRVDASCGPGQDGVDYIRRVTNGDFNSIEAKSKQLNAKIDSGLWSDLGLEEQP